MKTRRMVMTAATVAAMLAASQAYAEDTDTSSPKERSFTKQTYLDRAAERFERMDRNSDGAVDPAERREAWKEAKQQRKAKHQHKHSSHKRDAS